MAKESKKTTKRIGFHTGLYALDYFRYPAFPYRGRSWHIELGKPDPENCPTRLEMDEKSYCARELLIFARDRDSAQRAANLMHSSRLLLDGSTVMSHLELGQHHQVWPIGGPDIDEFGCDLRPGRHRTSTVNLPMACLVAAKASFKLEYVYAVAKLRVSFELASAPVMHLDPEQSDNIPKSPFPEDHVRMAQAVIAAWSCVEELGFDVRASSKTPSKLPDGTWNPPVKADLERRLCKGGVDLAEPLSWNLRGPRTRIERKKDPPVFTKAEWARWNVRDGDMRIIDAINYASYIRSSIAAHRSDKKMIRVLSIYDVANIQFLARRLLLEQLGFWRSLSEPWTSTDRNSRKMRGQRNTTNT